MRYLPAPGARVSPDEAQVIGDAIVRARTKYGEAFTVEQFETFCKNKKDPIHPIWLKKRNQLAATAGRTAAAYLIRSIVIEKMPGVDIQPKPVVIIMGDDKNGHVYSADMVESSPDLLDDYEQQYKTQVMGASRNFADVAGVERMQRANAEVMDEMAARSINRNKLGSA